MVIEAASCCSACGASNPAQARFCNQCTSPLGAASSSSLAHAERKQVTVLFSDLSGFTALTERLDPEETREIMSRVFGHAADIVARYDGRIEKFIGDAIMAIFGVPVAHEDDPVRAVRAALELHEAVAAMSPEIQARTGAPIALHSGVNTGLVVTGELKFDHGTVGPLGDTINLAARLMNAAPSGEVWVGRETRDLVGRVFELEDLGTREFKGKAQPVVATRVLGTSLRASQASHFRGDFIGRHAELGALLGAAERMRGGAPSVFGICGDAGTGKSRLIGELRGKVGTDVQWLEGRAYPYAQNIPYAPIIDLLSRSWTIEERDSPALVRAKIESGLATLLASPDEVLPLILHLYHLEQSTGVVIEREAFQDQLLDAVQQLLTALARRAPTVICFQDLHWSDASTATLLRGLCNDLHIPVLIVINYRPGFTPGASAQVLDLHEFSARQAAELVASLLKTEPPAALTRFVVERSDGNPFYIEEVINTLIETGVLRRAELGWDLTRALADAGVPATVRGVIAARIDRLDEPRRRVLRDAAVVGREFLYSIVVQLTQDTDQLAPSLAQLQAADLIRERRAEPDLEYIFKHALTQEVAYDGLLKSERQKLHARVAQAMEVLLADRIPEFVETLAYHFQRGGVTDKAIQYLGESGKKCVARYALAEATSHFRSAYALIAEGDRSPQQCRVLADLLVAWSQVHYYDGTIGEWLRLLEKHLADAERCGDAAVLSMYLGWLGNARIFHGDARGSLESIERALEISRTTTSKSMAVAVAHALTWRTYTMLFLGRVDDAIRSAEAVVQCDREIRDDPYPHFKSQAGLARALAYSGDLHRAREIAEKLVVFGRSSGSRRAESKAHEGLSLFWLLNLDFERAQLAAQAGIDASGDPTFASACALARATALGADLRFEAAAEVADEYLPDLLRNEDHWVGQPMRAARICADFGSGRLSKGMRDMLAVTRDARARGYAEALFFYEVYLALTYVSIARVDVRPSLRAIVFNPWFVVTQAPFAARKAGILIERLRAEADSRGVRGFLGLIDLAEGRLLAHQGKKARARATLERIRLRLREAGVDHVPSPVAALAAEVEH